MIPAVINIIDLNKACVIKWKNAIFTDPIEMTNIIIAICLKVDKAIIFFISCSQLADILAYTQVIVDSIIRIIIEDGCG